MKRPTRTGTIAVLIGVVLLTTVLLGEAHEHGVEFGPLTLFGLLRELGIAAVVLGAFNFILARHDWEDYFENRLRNIVMDLGYLRRLDTNALSLLMRNVFKAQAGDA